ncbi:hypothetical protein QC764_100450 [Podospora pseudoanserina]|uniref:Uncharacterized protein n=1 Tax=Podospora pseudoanserina TaxID=2609844 RepID=A0ABR0IJP4_9PEZI|nr:hypothetical protein QC764_100450 [Podospora pseudoanserina]
MMIFSMVDCEPAASSLFSCTELSRELEGESDWTITLMPRWVRSRVRGTSDSLARHIQHSENTHDLSTDKTLEEAAHQLSPPRFDGEYKRQRREAVVKKRMAVNNPFSTTGPVTATRTSSFKVTNDSIPTVVDTTLTSAISTATGEAIVDTMVPGFKQDNVTRQVNETRCKSQVPISNPGNACNDTILPAETVEPQPIDVETPSNTIATEEQSAMTQSHWQPPSQTNQVPIEHMLRKFGRVVDDVMYGIRRNGKVFWYYTDEPAYVPLTVREFVDFEAVYPAEYFPYHNNYYLAQMYGDNACLGGDYLMPLFLDNREWNAEKSMIVWAEWTRYFYAMATNDDMRQQARELARHEASMVWGPEFLNCSFTPLRYHEGHDEQTTYDHSQAETQYENAVGLEAGTQEMLAILHGTPASSSSKHKQQRANATIDIAQTEAPQRAQQMLETPSPPGSCLKKRSESDSSRTGSAKSVRFSDEVLLLGLVNRDNCGSLKDEQAKYTKEKLVESESGRVDCEESVEDSDRVEPPRTGLMSPAVVHRSCHQETKTPRDKAQNQGSVKEQRTDGSASLMGGHEVAQRFGGAKGVRTMSQKTSNFTFTKSDQRVIDTPNGRTENQVTPFEKGPYSPTSSTATQKSEKVPENTATVCDKTEQPLVAKLNAPADSTKGSDKTKAVWSKLVAASPESSQASSRSSDASPRGWRTFRKPPTSPGFPTSSRTEEMSSPVPAPKKQIVDLAEKIEESPASAVPAAKTPTVVWAEEVQEPAASPVQATPGLVRPHARQSLLPPPPRGQGGRTLIETLNTDMSWTQLQPNPVPRAPVNPRAPAPSPATARAGQRQENPGAGRRGRQGGQARRGSGKAGDVRGGSGEGRRGADGGRDSRGAGETAAGRSRGDSPGAKREMSRWRKLRNESSWR